MRISDWSSDVCSSDLLALEPLPLGPVGGVDAGPPAERRDLQPAVVGECGQARGGGAGVRLEQRIVAKRRPRFLGRSEEHTSELQSLMRISYAVFCLKKTKITRK